MLDFNKIAILSKKKFNSQKNIKTKFIYNYLGKLYFKIKLNIYLIKITNWTITSSLKSWIRRRNFKLITIKWRMKRIKYKMHFTIIYYLYVQLFDYCISHSI